MSRAVVEEMADRYYAEASYGKRSGLQDRGAEIRRRTEEMARELFEDEESYHPISMLKMNERTPVSYTHLDVYKRQAQRRSV